MSCSLVLSCSKERHDKCFSEGVFGCCVTVWCVRQFQIIARNKSLQTQALTPKVFCASTEPKPAAKDHFTAQYCHTQRGDSKLGGATALAGAVAPRQGKPSTAIPCPDQAAEPAEQLAARRKATKNVAPWPWQTSIWSTGWKTCGDREQAFNASQVCTLTGKTPCPGKPALPTSVGPPLSGARAPKGPAEQSNGSCSFHAPPTAATPAMIHRS
jgi:hypothetical protein